jgi:VWFA-related protein
VAGLALVGAGSTSSVQQSLFKTGTLTVSVNASVKKGNQVIANLRAKDFRLTDNGVVQTIDAVSIESVPVDVSLFLDTSGSTSGKLDEMKRDVQGILRMLRPGDRFRLLTIADSVDEPVRWVSAGTAVDLSFRAVGGISLVHDALVAALLHRPEADRRHLVVGMTDRRDCGSVVSSSQLREIASRSEAVLHLVDQSGSADDVAYRVRTCSPRGRGNGPEIIAEAATRTGGAMHTPASFFRSSPVLRAFRTIFDEFRQSYVLRYSPSGVARGGWHAIVVQVPSVAGATVRARQGYFD